MVSIAMGEGDERSALLPETTGESARASAHEGGVGVGNGFNRWASGKRVAMIAVGAVLGVCGLVGGYMHSTMPGVAPKEGDPDFRRLPPVDFDDKTLLIVVGLPFSGTSALEGLLGTSGVITDLCKSNTWQCENTVLLERMGFINENVHCDPEDVTAAEFAYAYKDFANKWWDMSKPVLMDKTPQNLCRPTKIRDAAAKLGVNVKFVVLTRHPFSWTSEKHPFNQGYYMEQMVMARNLLADQTMSTLQVRYEDMAWNMDAVIESVKAFVPEVSNIDPWRSSLSDDSGAERGLPVGKYFQEKPLEWIGKPLTPDTYRLLCQLNYNSDGECSYFN